MNQPFSSTVNKIQTNTQDNMLKSFSSSAPYISETTLEKEMESLSEEEKRRVHDDLYGGESSRLNDTPSQCEEALRQLQEKIDDMPDCNKVQYSRSSEKCPDYMNCRDFRLQFIRCECFDVDKAAKRFVNHWEYKVRLWGEDRAFKRVSVTDFDEEDQVALESGGVRLLPCKDSSGRGIIMVDRNYFDLRKTRRMSMQKLSWYIHQVAAEDADIQANGLIYVANSPVNSTSLMEQDRKLDSRTLTDVKEALPVRVVGIHHYVNSRFAEFLVPFLNVLLGGEMRKHYQIHGGSLERWQRELSEYGISPNIIQVMHGGSLEFDYGAWLKERRETGT